MAWEQRGRKEYYYRKRRTGGRVVSEYIGASEFAELLSQLDKLRRARRRAELAARRQRRELDLALGRRVDETCKQIRALIDATLLITGHHTHKGQWRRMRKQREVDNEQ